MTEDVNVHWVPAQETFAGVSQTNPVPVHQQICVAWVG